MAVLLASVHPVHIAHLLRALHKSRRATTHLPSQPPLLQLLVHRIHGDHIARGQRHYHRRRCHRHHQMRRSLSLTRSHKPLPPPSSGSGSSSARASPRCSRRTAGPCATRPDYVSPLSLILTSSCLSRPAPGSARGTSPQTPRGTPTGTSRTPPSPARSPPPAPAPRSRRPPTLQPTRPHPRGSASAGRACARPSPPPAARPSGTGCSTLHAASAPLPCPSGSPPAPPRRPARTSLRLRPRRRHYSG